MAIWGDYHTHTVYSHGKGTVEQNVQRAIEVGLKEVGITDHGVCVCPNNIPLKEVDAFLADVKHCREKYPQINIRAGVETNLLSYGGDVDLPDDLENRLDYVVCGYHVPRMLLARPKDFWNFCIPNMLFAHDSPKQITKNTDAYLKALERWKISVIAHPQKAIFVDIKVLAEAVKHYGIHMEINEKNFRLSRSDVDTVLDVGCKLILNSDAHTAENVGNISTALETMRNWNVPDTAYDNWEKFPDIKFNSNT